MEVYVRLDERLLGQILHLMDVPRPVQCKAIHSVHVAADQMAESVVGSIQGFLNQVGIGSGFHWISVKGVFGACFFFIVIVTE